MTYNTVATMAISHALTQRVTAAAATESIPDPEAWAELYRWEVAASPGWQEAWASAEASGHPNPGVDEAVITDGMILSAVQSIAASP